MFEANEWKCVRTFKMFEKAVMAADWTTNSEFFCVEDSNHKAIIYRIEMRDSRTFVPFVAS